MLLFSFLLATTALILQGILVPRLALLVYAPWIALLTLRAPLSKALWLSAFAGAIIDLLSDDPMGLHALNYALTTALLFHYKKHFSHDVPFHLSLFTIFISGISTLLQLVLLFLFDRRVPFDGKWIFSDLVGMPVVDGLYAFVWFTTPLVLFEQVKKLWVQFCLRKKNPSPTLH